MNPLILSEIKSVTGAQSIDEIRVIQTLWSDYGYIGRLHLDNGKIPPVIVKFMDYSQPNSHPRGWNTPNSHQRKVTSYEVETNWYTTYNKTDTYCRTPKCIGSKSFDNQHILVLEDLDAAGFPVRKSTLTITQTKVVLKWLANFHGLHLNPCIDGLWQEGTYWYLATRQDEWNEMDSGSLKDNAAIISNKLKNAQYQTMVHGDAKLANFCFSTDASYVAAVDFQYVGKGCGMKDVAYFLGSAITEKECLKFEDELLFYYFECLQKASGLTLESFEALEKEWRYLYAYAWTDFSRFLMGWMPTHTKLNSYTQRMMEVVLNELDYTK
tara:strand:+ start:12685 stop:13659 length:975 start_codon:yes stop_codon:yes gene_type:complete